MGKARGEHQERFAIDAHGLEDTQLANAADREQLWTAMGHSIDRDQFTDDEYGPFSARLEQSLRALEQVLARPGFGVGPTTMGAELELSLVDGNGRCLPRNTSVLRATQHPRITLELARYNLEINSRPVSLAGKCFTLLAEDLEDVLAEARRAAATQGGRLVIVGILPTVERSDLGPAMITDAERYRAISLGLKRLRKSRFPIRIDGHDALDFVADDVAVEGANTSFQLHLRVAPAEYARAYNAAQMATAPVLAAAGNSPIFLGHRLWEETRIALFARAFEDRPDAPDEDWRPARVSFGNGWCRTGALELFAESVAQHAPIMPVLGDEDPLRVLEEGRTPSLSELRLHHGTVWRWNRAVYDAADGGHLRIEMRALPSGPTVADMMANGAFMLGLTLGLVDDADVLVSRFTFGQARRNFFQAARHGLDAELLWPSAIAPTPQAEMARTLVMRLLPVARKGLARAGVDDEDADRLLGIIASRVRSGMTGACWQRRTFSGLRGRSSPRVAAHQMLERYLTLSERGRPVHEWDV